MDQEKVLAEFRACDALLEGHFILSSGLRSPLYMQCARVMMDPKRGERLCQALAEKIEQKLGKNAIDIVVSPAMGGVVVGYELARALGVLSVFAERVEGQFQLRRGFALEPGMRVLMAEDVVTTGKSSLECIACIEAHGGQVVAASALIDRSNGAAQLNVPFVALASVDIPTYEPDQLPAELQAIPAIKPGSRGLK